MYIGTKYIQLAVTAFLLAALCLLADQGFAGTATVVYDDDRLTVRAFDRPLEEVLQALSAELDADIYVADECRHLFVTLDVVSEPVEAALARVLRSVSYVALYRGSGSDAPVSGLKVFPKGKADTPMTLVSRGDAGDSVGQPGTVHPGAVSDVAEVHRETVGGTASAPGTTGILVPQIPERSGEVTLASVKALEGMEREKELHNEIRKLETEAESAMNEDVREALSVVLRDKIQEFHELQKANRNMQAALRRLELFESDTTTNADR